MRVSLAASQTVDVTDSCRSRVVWVAHTSGSDASAAVSPLCLGSFLAGPVKQCGHALSRPWLISRASQRRSGRGGQSLPTVSWACITACSMPSECSSAPLNSADWVCWLVERGDADTTDIACGGTRGSCAPLPKRFDPTLCTPRLARHLERLHTSVRAQTIFECNAHAGRSYVFSTDAKESTFYRWYFLARGRLPF